MSLFKKIFKTKKRGNSMRKSDGLVAVGDNLIHKEDLPFPYVHYASMYGAFHCFSKQKHSKLYLCSCSKKAIKNYIELKLINPDDTQNTDPTRMYILDSFDFSKDLVQRLMNEKGLSVSKVFNHLSFAKKICHVCNNQVPHYKYCSPMYGEKFKQNFGWYINQKYYELGIDNSKSNLPLSCSKEIIAINLDLKPLVERLNKLNTRIFVLQDRLYSKTDANGILKKELSEEDRKKLDKKLCGLFGKKRKLDSSYGKKSRELNNIVENLVRDKLGYKRVGEGWVSEMILFNIVKSLLPKQDLVLHYHPDFLNGLEIDIFIKDKNIAIEYQGAQHFKSISWFGGEKAFEKQKKRDLGKRNLCKKKGMPLVYFNYDEDLTNELVLNKLKPFF